jgi:hypothetical protein
MSIPNFVTVEDIIPHIPEQYKGLLEGAKWEDVTFTTFSICDTALLDYEITEDGRLYRKEEDGSLQLIDDYTGKIEFGTVVLTEDEDLEVALEALFFKGDLRSLSFLDPKKLDRKPREEAQSKLMDVINQQEARSKKWWYKLYLFYSKIVVFIFTCIRWVFGAIIKLCWIIQNKIT